MELSMRSAHQQGELFEVATQISPPDRTVIEKPTISAVSTTHTVNVEPREADKPPLWLCIQLPWLILEAARLTVPYDNSDPIAWCVYQRQGNQDLVLDCNRLARRRGVTNGMTLSHAYALSPKLDAIPRNKSIDCLLYTSPSPRD